MTIIKNTLYNNVKFFGFYDRERSLKLHKNVIN